jgi:DNA-binding SARP family transcriptional activator
MPTQSNKKIYLTIALFGTHQVALNGNPVIHFEAESARALLAYLVMEVGRVHQRETLAALLWPDHATSDALANLRQALNRLRHAVGDREAVPPILNITRKTIQFNPAGEYWLDVATFDALTTAVNRHPHPDLGACPECLQRLQEAANIYRGELLDQFVMESALFEEWLHRRRDHYHRRAITTLDQLASGYETCGEYERAQAIIERQIELEPWRENAHRRLMRMLALRGQRGAALLQYQRCCQMLNDELDVEPAAETTALYHQIRAGSLVANGGTAVSQPITAVSLVKGDQLFSRKHNLTASL